MSRWMVLWAKETSELAIYFTPMHFMWGVKSGATLHHINIKHIDLKVGSCGQK